MASPAQTPPRPPLPPRPPRSLAGPVVLIVMGGIFLLGTMGILHLNRLALGFAHFWPLLIILWGVIKLMEHHQAQRAGTHARGIGVGGVFLLIMLIVFGLMATQAAHFNWEAIRDQIDAHGGDFPFFGHTFEYDDQLAQNFPAATSLNVLNDRGAVNVTVSQDNQVHVTVHKRVSAESQREADQWNAGSKPHFDLNGGVLTLNANTHSGDDHWVDTDLTISLPRKAGVVISTRHGDVNVLGRDGDTEISNQHGDVAATDINGKVTLHLEQSSARVSQIASDVAVDGHADDVSIEDVKGEVHLTGDFTENLKLSKIAKAVSFKTSRTEMEFARLDGDLDLDSGNLEVENVTGPLRMETRSKDIRLAAVSGDVHLSDENGAVEIRVSKLGSMQVSNKQGDIEIYVPEKAGFQVDARASNGEVQSDFGGLKLSNDDDQGLASGTVGAGGPLLTLNNEHGTITIHKGSSHAEPATPVPPKPPKVPQPVKPAVAPVPDEIEN